MKILPPVSSSRHPVPGNTRARLSSLAAFTMIEIALCLAIIGFALVAIIGVLPIGMNVQKNNREETLINFDANYLMSVIRSGPLGANSLTNYIVALTNTSSGYKVTAVGAPFTSLNSVTNWYSNSISGGSSGGSYLINGVQQSTNFLVTGSNIVGLLSVPKYVNDNSGVGQFFSNSVSADFRAISGSPLDQGYNQTSRDFAFIYRVFIEITPVVTDPNLLPLNTNNLPSVAMNMQSMLYDVRLRFRWPVLPGNQLGSGSAVYRTTMSGQFTNILGAYYFLPQSYVANSNSLSLP